MPKKSKTSELSPLRRKLLRNFLFLLRCARIIENQHLIIENQYFSNAVFLSLDTQGDLDLVAVFIIYPKECTL
jgi:hypothetical protein